MGVTEKEVTKEYIDVIKDMYDRIAIIIRWDDVVSVNEIKEESTLN